MRVEMTDGYRQLIAGIALDHMRPAERHWTHALGQRLDATPMAQPLAAAGHLRNLLSGMLLVHSSGPDRIELLGHIRTKIQPLLDGLFRHIAADGYPLPAAKASLAAAMLEVCDLAGRNTCMAVWELAGPSGRLPWVGRRRLVQALNDALEELREVLALSFQGYAEPPAGTWQRLHALYAFAAAGGVAARRVTVRGEQRACSARRRYAHALLLAMANPWGLQRAELLGVDAVAAELAAVAAFGGASGRVPVHGASADSGPVHHGAAETVEAPLGLDLAPVLAALDGHLAAASEAQPTLGFDDGRGNVLAVRRQTLERVARAWRGHVERGFERLRGEHPMLVLVGLRALHQALAGGLDFDAFRDQLAGAADAMRVPASPAAPPLHVRARVLDQSLGGYRLLWSAAEDVRFRIGEVVGLVPAAASGEAAGAVLMLGALRWLRNQDEGMTVGVELLARAPLPAVVRTTDRGGRRSPPQRGLLTGMTAGRPELVLERILDTQVAAVEVIWQDASEPAQGAITRRKRYPIAQTHELSQAYFRLALASSRVEETA